MRFPARFVVRGAAQAEAVVGQRPLNTLASFLTALATRSGQGTIGDPQHDLYGIDVKGKVLVVPTTIGSTTAGLVFLEAIRQGIAPCAVVVREIDTLLATGGILAEAWFDQVMPIAEVAQPEFWQTVQSGVQLSLEAETSSISLDVRR